MIFVYFFSLSPADNFCAEDNKLHFAHCICQSSKSPQTFAGAGGSGNYALNFAREREGAGARSKILRGSGGERERSQKFFAGAGGAGKRSEKMRGRGGCGRNSPALLLPRDPAGKKKGN